MKMKKFIIFSIVVFLVMSSLPFLWAGDPFKFPERFDFKLLKNDRIVGSCRLEYEQSGKQPGTSTLRLKNFQGLGFTSQEWLVSYIYAKDSSIYADFIMKGKTPVSEIRLKEGTAFDGTKGQVFVYKDLESSDDKSMQTEIFTKYTVIDLLSMLFVTSQRVAEGKMGADKFNFLIDKSTKIVDMMPIGQEKVPFQGKEVSTRVFSFAYNGQEIFKVKIFKDVDGACFPVSIEIITDFTGSGQSIELRADKVSIKSNKTEE
ncbi:MAG: hypothetical protein L0Y73_05630 [Candidatus Aminicenantes bacterium]|nr:hypothetical protein [Candidatus Aminicenantes bacterium]